VSGLEPRRLCRGSFPKDRNLVKHSEAATALFALTLLTYSAPALAADAAAGKAKAQVCAVCHGLNGIAKVPDAPNLSGESAVYTTKQLNAFKEGKRQHEQMSLIAASLSDEDIADLAAWYASLKVTVEMP
jgi:cytochrome c553